MISDKPRLMPESESSLFLYMLNCAAQDRGLIDHDPDIVMSYVSDEDIMESLQWFKEAAREVAAREEEEALEAGRVEMMIYMEEEEREGYEDR